MTKQNCHLHNYSPINFIIAAQPVLFRIKKGSPPHVLPYPPQKYKNKKSLTTCSSTCTSPSVRFALLLPFNCIDIFTSPQVATRSHGVQLFSPFQTSPPTLCWRIFLCTRPLTAFCNNMCALEEKVCWLGWGKKQQSTGEEDAMQWPGRYQATKFAITKTSTTTTSALGISYNNYILVRKGTPTMDR